MKGQQGERKLLSFILKNRRKPRQWIKVGASDCDGGFVVIIGSWARSLALQFEQMGGGWTFISKWKDKSGHSHGCARS